MIQEDLKLPSVSSFMLLILPYTMDHKVLIANRGEIAIRIANACAELGIPTVAVHADDSDTAHLPYATESLKLAGGPSAFLKGEAIIEAARRAKATAIHPGYGFLSESADFASTCHASGIIFIGPTPATIAEVSDKIRARKLAGRLGIPTVLGTVEDSLSSVSSPMDVEAFGLKVGYPIVIKARDGGGGRGIRVVGEPGEVVRSALARCLSESPSKQVFLEKAIVDARHIEVQILGDSFGNAVHLYERDCSVQRRFQKIVEIAPSPTLPSALLSHLHKAAIALAQAIKYTTVGTVEFLVPTAQPNATSSPVYYFLEVNPRIQVEHTVTESVIGLDLVKLQLLVSPLFSRNLATDLGLTQQSIPAPHGFAIQSRLISEDPARGFAPSTGRITALNIPTGGTPGVRIDTWLHPRAVVSPHYDSLLAKVIVWAPTFAEAVERSKRVLAETVVGGVKTNRDLLVCVLADREFVEQEVVTTRWLEGRMASLLETTYLSAFEEALALCSDDGATGPAIALSASMGAKIQFKPGDAFTLNLASAAQSSNSTIKIQTIRQNNFPATFSGTVALSGSDALYAVTLARSSGTSASSNRRQATSPGDVAAPLTGQVVELPIGVGGWVEAGQEVLVVSAMKMETVVRSSVAGVVRGVHAEIGEIVGEGEVVIEIESGEVKSKLRKKCAKLMCAVTNVQDLMLQLMYIIGWIDWRVTVSDVIIVFHAIWPPPLRVQHAIPRLGDSEITHTPEQQEQAEMKFGKHIQSAQITEWSAHYLDYKGLKKIINSLAAAPGEKTITSVTVAANLPPGVVPEDQRFKSVQKTAFFFKLERELEKKENELRVRLRSLVDKKKILASKRGRYTRESTSLNSLKEAFRQFDQDLNKLQVAIQITYCASDSTQNDPKGTQQARHKLFKFVELNGTGFRKILKKWDKRSKSSTKELYLSRQVDIQPCFDNEVLSGLADQAATNLVELENLSNGIITSTSPRDPQRIEFNVDHTDTAVVDDLENELYKAVANGQSSTAQDILERIRQHPTPEDGDRISRVFWHACSEASPEMIQPLVGTGLVNFKYVDDINDRSCLHEAAITGRLPFIELCVGHGVDVNTTDVYGRTPLHYASMYGHTDCATFLLSHKADVTPVDHDGFNPLIYAIINGHTECVKILLQNGASVEPRKEGDHNPLSLACQYGHKDIATTLTSKGAQILPDAEGLFPLHLAAREGHADLCKLLTLTEKNTSLDTQDKYNGWTPIFYAASEGHIDCVRILLEAGCKVNVKDENGATPLYYAAWEGEVECVNLLIEAGCEIEIVDEKMEDDTIGEPMEDIDIDTIPSLSLPPPIIPFRIYGHNYLDKKYQIQLTLGHHSGKHSKLPIHLYGNTQISSLKLIITSKPDSGMIPHSVILPLGDEREIFSFQVDRVENFSLEFDIFPTFGSKVIGKGVALPINFDLNSDHQYRRFGPLPNGTGAKCIIPLFDTHLKVVGELAFEFAIIRPFQGVQLEIGGRVETYWKSTNTVGAIGASSAMSSEAPSSSATPTTGVPPPPSLTTVSSLSGEYVQVIVQVTRDAVPVVFSRWRLDVDGFDLCVSDVTYEQFRAFGERQLQAKGKKVDEAAWRTGSSVELHRLIHDSYLSLEHVLKTLAANLGVNIEIKYPTAPVIVSLSFSNLLEINGFVDSILQCVYDHAHTANNQAASSLNSSGHRQLIFSSFNPAVCTAMNRKQPN
ncbi:hypothetical protein BC938DRAFT_479880 [Jimgerdemannia flammicorona]|uniref:Acetyl-CoA carboxylase n=1 Tax=Jimgerdemannia flammicorona TaxID=994334 RepID=A0A433QJX1_9FUNG|nr:hypothetical protein BC938DRAFT_479880 [Jimgerdemannia flammicorona]